MDNKKGFKVTLSVDMWLGAVDEQDALRITNGFIESDIEGTGGLVRNVSVEPDPDKGYVSDNSNHLTNRFAKAKAATT